MFSSPDLHIHCFRTEPNKKNKQTPHPPTFLLIFLFIYFRASMTLFRGDALKLSLKTGEVGTQTPVATLFQHSANDAFQLCAITKLVQRAPCRPSPPIHSCRSHRSEEVLHHKVHATARCRTERRGTPAGTQHFIEAHEYFMPSKTGPHDFACQGSG